MAPNPRDEFVSLITDINKAKGLDGLTSRIIGLLYISPSEISLEGLSMETGYSLSAVSTAMKLLVRSGYAKRIKKPGSKKIYFFMEKGMIDIFVQAISKAMDSGVQMAKAKVPAIIALYRKEKGAAAKKELAILENYYAQLLAVEGALRKFTALLEDAKKDAARGRG